MRVFIAIKIINFCLLFRQPCVLFPWGLSDVSFIFTLIGNRYSRHSGHHILLRLPPFSSSRELYLDVWAWVSIYRKPSACCSDSSVKKLFCLRSSGNVPSRLWCGHGISLPWPVHDSVIAEKGSRRRWCNVPDSSLNRESYILTHHCCHSIISTDERYQERW